MYDFLVGIIILITIVMFIIKIFPMIYEFLIIIIAIPIGILLVAFGTAKIINNNEKKKAKNADANTKVNMNNAKKNNNQNINNVKNNTKETKKSKVSSEDDSFKMLEENIRKLDEDEEKREQEETNKKLRNIERENRDYRKEIKNSREVDRMLEDKMNFLGLDDFEKNEVRKGNYEPEDFDEGFIEDEENFYHDEYEDDDGEDND